MDTRAFLVAKHAEFPSIPSTNVFRLFESTDNGPDHGDEPAVHRYEPPDASGVPKRKVPSDDVGSAPSSHLLITRLTLIIPGRTQRLSEQCCKCPV